MLRDMLHLICTELFKRFCVCVVVLLLIVTNGYVENVDWFINLTLKNNR